MRAVLRKGIDPNKLPVPILDPSYPKRVDERIPPHLLMKIQDEDGWTDEEREKAAKQHKENSRRHHPKAYSPEMEERIWKMYLEGMSYREIGDAVGRTRKAIDNRINKIRKEKELSGEWRKE